MIEPAPAIRRWEFFFRTSEVLLGWSFSFENRNCCRQLVDDWRNLKKSQYLPHPPHRLLVATYYTPYLCIFVFLPFHVQRRISQTVLAHTYRVTNKHFTSKNLTQGKSIICSQTFHIICQQTSIGRISLTRTSHYSFTTISNNNESSFQNSCLVMFDGVGLRNRRVVLSVINNGWRDEEQQG